MYNILFLESLSTKYYWVFVFFFHWALSWAFFLSSSVLLGDFKVSLAIMSYWYLNCYIPHSRNSEQPAWFFIQMSSGPLLICSHKHHKHTHSNWIHQFPHKLSPLCPKHDMISAWYTGLHISRLSSRDSHLFFLSNAYTLRSQIRQNFF